MFLVFAGCSAAVAPDIDRLGPDSGSLTDADVGTPTDAQQCSEPEDCLARPFASASCNNGTCAFECDDGRGDCDGDPSNGCEASTKSAQNCGGCGINCGPGTCVDNTCQVLCPPNSADCDGQADNGCEVDLRDVLNCGACNQSCQDGELCNAAGDTPECSASCPPGTTQCGMSCVETESDAKNCGECGNACEAIGAIATCNQGECDLGDCNPGLADCDESPENGCESDLSSSETCGNCDTQCSAENNASSACTDNGCAYECDTGYADCDNDLGEDRDGCESDIVNDIDNCGGCGVECEREDNANVDGCFAGQCVHSCRDGFADCNGDLGRGGDGCETRTSEDPNNCGGCGMICQDLPKARAQCRNNVCERTCEGEFDDCDGDLNAPNSNGCEASLNHVDSCGACAVQCSAMNTIPACRNQTCEIEDCSTNYCDTDGLPQNGCERHLYDQASCMAPQFVGNVVGDRGSSTLNLQGVGNTAMRVRVTESRNNIQASLSASFSFAGPGQNTYRLTTYCDNCNVPNNTGTSSNLFASVLWDELCPDITCSPDSSRDIIVVVRQTSGNSCELWGLRIVGNQFFQGANSCSPK